MAPSRCVAPRGSASAARGFTPGYRHTPLRGEKHHERLMPAYLQPDILARAEALGLKARQLVEGLRVGDHRSPYKGFSVEFVQHREYVPGDDIRHIDWKSYGRSERYTIKQYEQ